jgi:hypothetical protein
MPKVLKKTEAQIATIKTHSSFDTFSAVGVGLHRRNSTSLKWSTQMDPDCERLFHQVDRSGPHRSASQKVIISFLEDIIARFGCPSKIIIDNSASFKSEPLIKFYKQFQISLVHSTPYYPQGNGLAESSNKSLIKIIKR